MGDTHPARGTGRAGDHPLPGAQGGGCAGRALCRPAAAGARRHRPGRGAGRSRAGAAGLCCDRQGQAAGR